MSTLPKAPDADTLTLLSRANQFMAHALSHSTGTSSLDRMITVHGLDSGIENLLRIVIQHLDVESATGRNLDTTELGGLAGETNRFLKDNYGIPLPYLSEIKQIRQIRNLVQHGMVDAGPDIPRCCTIAERFFDRVLNGVFGIQREDIRVASLIHNDEVKRHLVAAEQGIDKGMFLESVVASRNAFENALFERRKHSALRLFALPVLADTHASQRDSHWFYSRMLDELELLRFGVDMDRYGRFADYVGHIPGEYRIDRSGGWMVMQRPWERKDAAYCYDFVSDVLLMWQNAEMPRIYDLRTDRQFRFRLIIGDSDLSERLEGGGSSILKGGALVEQHYVARRTKEQFDRLEVGSKYDYLSERYGDGKLEFRRKSTVEIKAKIIALATHDPERWQCTIWYADTVEPEIRHC